MRIDEIEGIGSATAEKLNTLGIHTTDDIKNIKDLLGIKYLGSTQIQKIIEAKGGKASIKDIEFIRNQYIIQDVMKTKAEKPKRQTMKIVPKKSFIPSKYQQAIFDTVDDPDNIIIEAVAGSGKTSTVVEFINYIPADKSIIFLAFNKHIKEELEKKLPENVDVHTLHSLGLDILKRNGLKLKLYNNDEKLNMIYEDEIIKPNKYKLSKEDYDSLKSSLFKIVNFIKNTQAHPEKQDIEYIIDRFSIELPECLNDSISYDDYCNLVKYLYILSIQKYNKCIDFQDMIFFPTFYNLVGKQYDYVFVDEAQDLNKTQLEIVASALKSNGKLVAIGDSSQAIYSFRGGDSESMKNIKDRFKCKALPLSITYRCPKSHVKYVQQFVPSIEAAPNAKEGEIINIKDDEFTKYVKENDLVLCRYNAPLFSPCLKLIAMGKKARIVGSDFDKTLIKLIDNLKPKSVIELNEKLNRWYSKEIANLEKIGANTQQVNDKYECIRTLINMSNAKKVDDIKSYIREIFKKDKPEISFSTVHKAKGLEAENIFIYYPNLMPSVYAKKDWEMQQEENLEYVAYTRSLNRIYNVFPITY